MKRIVVLLISCIVISCQDNAIECVNYSGVVMSQGNLKSKIDVIDFPFCLWKKSKSVDVQARSTYSSSVSVTKKGYHKIGFVVEYDFNTYYGAMAEMEVRDYLSDKIIEYDARSIIVEDDVMGDFISMYFPADIFDINTAVGIFQQFESLYENAFFSYAYNVNVVVKDHVEWIEEETGGGGGGKGMVYGEGEFDEGKYQSMYSRWQGYKDYEGLLEYDPRLLKEIIYEILN